MYMRLIGYPADKISILTTYNGQKHLIRDVIQQRCAENRLIGRPHKVLVKVLFGTERCWTCGMCLTAQWYLIIVYNYLQTVCKLQHMNRAWSCYNRNMCSHHSGSMTVQHNVFWQNASHRSRTSFRPHRQLIQPGCPDSGRDGGHTAALMDSCVWWLSCNSNKMSHTVGVQPKWRIL